MSPEQARGETMTTASDMYSFGLILQELFTGRGAYPERLSAAEVLEWARRAETLPVKSIDKDITYLINRMKSPASAARPTAVETADRLTWIQLKSKRLRRALALSALGLLLLAGGVKYVHDVRAERRLVRFSGDWWREIPPTWTGSAS